MIKVAIVDDHQIVIDGLELILQDHINEIEVVGAYNNGTDLLNRIRMKGLELVVLDISLPEGKDGPEGPDGLDTLKAIKVDFPETKVLMLTMHKDTTKIKTAIQHGAEGYLLKNHSGKELVKAIKVISQGEKYFSQDVRDTFFEDQMKSSISGQSDLKKVKISDAEAMVLQLLAEDMSAKLIAEELNKSIKTIETHKSNLMKKTGWFSEKGLVRFAVEHGYVRKKNNSK